MSISASVFQQGKSFSVRARVVGDSKWGGALRIECGDDEVTFFINADSLREFGETIADELNRAIEQYETAQDAHNSRHE